MAMLLVWCSCVLTLVSLQTLSTLLFLQKLADIIPLHRNTLLLDTTEPHTPFLRNRLGFYPILFTGHLRHILSFGYCDSTTQPQNSLLIDEHLYPYIYR